MPQQARAEAARSRRYRPEIGGHAPTDLRDAFCDAIDTMQLWSKGEPEPLIQIRDTDLSIRVVFGLLRNCTDSLPRDLAMRVARLVDRMPVTYGTAARLLKAKLS